MQIVKTVFLVSIYILGLEAHGVYKMYDVQQQGPYIQYPVNYVPNNGQYQYTQTRQSHSVSCCLLKQCRNGRCQETFTCGKGCPAVFTQPTTNMELPHIEQPNTQDLFNLMRNPGFVQATPTQDNQPKPSVSFNFETNPNLNPNTPKQNNQPKPYPSFVETKDDVPETQTIPGIFGEPTPQKTTPKPKEKVTTKPPKKEECPKPDAIQFPKEDTQDYGATPGYDKKKSYVYDKCDKGKCERIEKKCDTCPDPFDHSFRLYNVKKDCFNCYHMPCVPPK